MSRVLLVGGCGYLGHHVLNYLMAHEVTVYDNLLYRNDYLNPVKFIYGDVRDTDKLKNSLQGKDAVIWLAAIVGDAAVMVNPSASIEVNQKSLEALADYRGRVIFMSSCSVYGVNDGIATEESELAPQSLYAETKIEAERILKDRAIIFRLGTLHGVSERLRFDLVVNVLAERAVSQGRLEVFGGKQYRPLLAVQDAASAIVQTLGWDAPNGTYNLASENLTISEIAERVKVQIPEVEIKTVPSQFEDKRNYRVDCSKAKKILKFAPYLTVDDSIRDIATVIREGRVKNLNDLSYSNLTALGGSSEKSGSAKGS